MLLTTLSVSFSNSNLGEWTPTMTRPTSAYLACQSFRYGSVRMQFTQVYVQKSMRTTLPRRSSMVSGSELSQLEMAWNSGASSPTSPPVRWVRFTGGGGVEVGSDFGTGVGSGTCAGGEVGSDFTTEVGSGSCVGVGVDTSERLHAANAMARAIAATATGNPICSVLFIVSLSAGKIAEGKEEGLPYDTTPRWLLVDSHAHRLSVASFDTPRPPSPILSRRYTFRTRG